MRAAIYARVSTRDQSPEMQVQDLRRFAGARGWEIIGEYVDQASGATTSRPEFDRMMEAIRRREADVLLCWKFDRVGRSVAHLLGVLEELRALGVGFVSMTEGIDTTTPTGRMIFTFLAALAEFERALIRERVLAGVQAAKARGVKFGRPRKGIDAAEALRLRREGYSYSQIARRLHVSRSLAFRTVKTLSEALEPEAVGAHAS